MRRQKILGCTFDDQDIRIAEDTSNSSINLTQDSENLMSLEKDEWTE